MNIYNIAFINNDGNFDGTQLNANSEEEAIALLWTMEEEYDLASVDSIEMVGVVRYYVNAFAYDYSDHITNFEHTYGSFDNEEDAYLTYREVVDEAIADPKRFFENTDDSVWYWKVQVEQCEETDDGCSCADIDEEEDIYRDLSDLVRFELSFEEANAIDRVMSVTKMDCWFLLVSDDGRTYYVHDIERNSPMQLDEALGRALDGFIDLKLGGVTDKEIQHVADVVERLGRYRDAVETPNEYVRR